MFRELMNFLTGEDASRQPPDLRMSVAMLLMEAAHSDGKFEDHERAVIARLLADHFSLSPEECAKLVATAEEKQKDLVQIQPYTHEIFECMEPAERVQVIEMLWEIAYADGTLHPEEDALVRKVAGLIFVDDHARMQARQRVVARLRSES